MHIGKHFSAANRSTLSVHRLMTLHNSYDYNGYCLDNSISICISVVSVKMWNIRSLYYELLGILK